LGEEGADGLARRHPIASANAVRNARFDVAVQYFLVKRPFVAERVVEAGSGETRPLDEIAHRGGLIAALPEALHRRIEHDVLVKFPWSRHPISRLPKARRASCHNRRCATF